MVEKNYPTTSGLSNETDTALFIALRNNEVKQILSGVNYTIIDAGPGAFASGSLVGGGERALTRIDIDTDRSLLTVWVDVSNQSVVYINDYPKRSPPPNQ